MYDNIHFIHGGKFISRGKWQHPGRTIDNTEIIIVTKGTVCIALDGREYTLAPGDVLRISQGVYHCGTRISENNVSFYWLHFNGAEECELPPVYLHPENIAQAELIARQLLHYASTEGYPQECVDYLIRLLIIELNTEDLRATASNHRIFSAVKEWVRVNCDLPIKVVDVARQFNYNEDYLNRVFKTFYPDGLKAYIDAMKMQRIKNDLINESMSLADISARYSFGDYKYFLKYFKYHEGVSPTKYRQAYYNLHTNNK